MSASTRRARRVARRCVLARAHDRHVERELRGGVCLAALVSEGLSGVLLDDWLERSFEQSPMGLGIISSVESRCVRANGALARLYQNDGVEDILAARSPLPTLALTITHPEDLPAERGPLR